MIGIYKITNLQTGKIYIGQSRNIKQRIIEHRCPKPKHNRRLHEDMERFGLENFSFEVVEECEPNCLNERELFYIKTLLPYYNTVGKPQSDEVKEKLRSSGKKQWANMSEKQKRFVIEHNLKGPSAGHPVLPETREKLRKANVGKRRFNPVQIVETGEVFPAAKECAEYLGVSVSAVRYNISGKTELTKGYHIRRM